MKMAMLFVCALGLVGSACSGGDPGGAVSSYAHPSAKPSPAPPVASPVPDRASVDAGAAPVAFPIADAGSAPDSHVIDAGDAALPSDGFDAFQHHNLDAINAYRTAAGRPPLTLDAKLAAFAIAGSQDLAQTHSPHRHFSRASSNGTLFSSGGFNGSAAENQGDPSGWTQLSQDPTVNEMGQIDAILEFMMAEGRGGGHRDNMMSSTYQRLGVGLVEVQGELYLTNDFSD